MELRADRAYRRNAISREDIGEQLRGLHLHRVSTRYPRCSRRVRQYLSAADDHHEQFVGADERNRGPRGHSRTGKAMP
jgi:hypothetical protein